jgi:hypothetical protein
MLNIVKIISSEISNTRRFLKFLKLGKKDIQTSYEAMPPGVDAAPIEGMKAVYAKTGVNGKDVIIGYININQISKAGEHKIFATDKVGNEKRYIHLKNDNTVEFGGTGNFLVKYNELKENYDKTKEVLDSILTILNGAPIPEPGNGAPSALQTALSSALAGKSTGDISGSKISDFKTF